MMSLRILVISCIALGCAAAQEQHNTQPQPATMPAASAEASAGLSADSSVDQVLDALDRRGQNLRTLTADVRMKETDQAMGDETARSGRVWLENRPDGTTRFHALFDRKEEGTDKDKKVTEDKIEYVLDGGKLIDRNYRKTTQVTRVVLRPGEKMNLLKLGEGPFPLPIGQKKEDVHAAFEVKKMDAGKDDPPGCVKIELVPKPDTSLARKFKWIDVCVNVQDQLPQRIETLDANETSVRTTDLKNLKLNSGVDDADFALPKVNEDQWHLIDEPLQDDGRQR